MRKLLLFLPLFFIGCTISQKITYKTDDLAADKSVTPIPVVVDVRIFTDNRDSFEANSVLFSNPHQMRLDGKQMCINSEKHYKKDTVVNQFSRILVDHFNKARLFEMSLYDQSRFSDYYMTGTLNSFYAQQEYSTGAAVGASFGLVGALATSGIKTPGKIIIDVSDLKLFRKDGTLVKDFGSFYKEYVDEFKVDAYCWCAFWNANLMLKDFNTFLIEKIRNDMEGVALE
ncbi:hypothetical protein [Marinilabilia salmonicolor]|uniref:Lipoprotein n=1 Tax=Marinilabilia salmonicolor TaxID=989 RepID=A0A368UTE3_9BACT|nr:hypothetical protein [Marinilabilia salmonicolor]RCW32056.1 hypothetical protein DFO77_116123 [Marinilabilia salmonicolor]